MHEARKKQPRQETPKTHLRPPNPPKRDPPLHIPLFPLIGQIPLVELRADRARQQGVATDAVPAQRAGAALHERQHPGFGGRVVRLAGAADEGADGRDADDAAAWG